MCLVGSPVFFCRPGVPRRPGADVLSRPLPEILAARNCLTVSVAGRLTIDSMAAQLRVDPERLHAAAQAQAAVGAYVAGINAGQSVAGAVQAMSGLASGQACQVVAAALDGAAAAVSADLTAHSERLSAAAQRYQQADSEFGQRLRRIAE